MKSQHITRNIDDVSKQNEHPQHRQDINKQESLTGGLIFMLERLSAYFQQRTLVDDRETLVFCLQHLFRHIDELYCETLPALATITHTASDALTLSPSVSKTRLKVRYALWSRLQEMQQHIERVESLCHLLNRTVPRLLGVLDMLDECQNNQDVRSQAGLIHQEDGSEQWQRAYERLTARLNVWQERNGGRLSFSDMATSLPSTDGVDHAPSSSIRPLLTKIDAALMLVLDCAGAIFGDIVPDFQIIARGDDEAIATLLFDLMQQADLLLIQCNALFGPLQNLIRHYMLLE